VQVNAKYCEIWIPKYNAIERVDISGKTQYTKKNIMKDVQKTLCDADTWDVFLLDGPEKIR
jgi:hypothetical protein